MPDATLVMNVAPLVFDVLDTMLCNCRTNDPVRE
jgi:hypothetical protein